MIDRDGIERPDNPSEHMLTIKNTNRKVKFDENYSFRPRNIFQRMWLRFFRRLAITVFHVHWDFAQSVKLRNKKNLMGLRKKGFVIVVNHVNLFDDVSVCSTIFHWRMVYFTTLEQNIRRPMIGFYLRSLGGIPIPVSSVSGMRKFESDVSELLKKGIPVIYNPETALWPYYREIRPFKRGAFSMAVKSDVPILPITITFKRKKKRNGKFKYKMFLNIGTLIERDKNLSDKEASEKLMNDTHEYMSKVAKEFYESEKCGFDDEKDKKQGK